MSRRPFIVLADDLTGAAEVAAIAHEAGRSALVLTAWPRKPVAADVLVFDTDTRLATPAAAVRRIRATLRRLPPHAGLFKKTDSVLRGPVLAELEACRAALGLQRVLLVAGNPSLGRVIRDGRCFIDGRPLDQTAFALDPHHPAKSAGVLELLGQMGKPPARIVVADHRSAADTARWARAVDRRTLPAGAADFFRAWLRRKIQPRPRLKPAAWPAGPVLVLHGTLVAPPPSGAVAFHGLRPPTATKVALRLRHRGTVTVAAMSLTAADPLAPPKISQGFASLAQNLRDAGAFRHLVIVGGATAAAVLRGLGWSALKVVRVWGPGVVTLQPVADPAFTVTLKPGSYPWPASIRRLLPRVFSSHA